jgi:hypothetical protein
MKFAKQIQSKQSNNKTYYNQKVESQKKRKKEDITESTKRKENISYVKYF